MADPVLHLPLPLLEQVSRSFYWTMRILPVRIRPQIGLAYLLARTSDTIADTALVPVEQRRAALQALRERILGTRPARCDFSLLAGQQSLPAERVLLERCEETVGLLGHLPPADLTLVRQVLDIITSGQDLDLARFAGVAPGQVRALETDAELDDYTFRVAGCVGEFWTRLCHAHLFPQNPLAGDFSIATGIRFGKGLQLTNILRDLPEDLKNGRCYLPKDRLAEAGLQPADLLKPGAEPRLRSLYQEYLDVTEGYLRAGWAYTKAIPRPNARLRLACAWPILIGLETIGLLRQQSPLTAPTRIKISRARFRSIVFRSLIRLPSSSAWARLVPPPAPR